MSFNRAIVRTPSRSVVDGLRAVDVGAPSYEGVLDEHSAYVRTLEAAGVEVDVLPALEAFPDSVFVEDAALVFTGAAILLCPGARTRRGEVAEIAPAIEQRFARVLRLEQGSAEGGDVLTTSRGVFIGVSARTTIEGAEALVKLLTEIGQRGVVVGTPPGVLHLKSDCAQLDEDTVLCTRRLAAAEPFPGFRILLTPDGEEGAANAIRVGGQILLSDGYPATVELLEREGHKVTQLATREIGKIDAGLSCMSLRWTA